MMKTAPAIFILFVVVAAMLFTTKVVTDAWFDDSKHLLRAEANRCMYLDNLGAPRTAADRRLCDELWSRNGAINQRNERAAVAMLIATGLVALIGFALIWRNARRRDRLRP